MAVKRGKVEGPAGGVRAGERSLRGWSWNRRGKLISRPVRCKKEEWYIARAALKEDALLERAELLVTFFAGEEPVRQRSLRLHSLAHAGREDELIGWTETPEDATHLQLCIPDFGLTGAIEEIVLHDVSERDPKCHPLANVPRWKAYKPPFTLERVILPTSLARLEEELDGIKVELADPPRSMSKLRAMARGAAAILDPAWVRSLKLSLADVEQLARSSWLIIDLETLTRLLKESGAAPVELITHSSLHGIMSARVEYADVPTRGLALQDVIPYAYLDGESHFCLRGIKNSSKWRRYADEVGMATLLSSETPWEHKHADVLAAMRPVPGGELIATDVPWLVARRFGPLVAPQLATHLLRMLVGLPANDHLQYWMRWEDPQTLVRDITDLAKRYGMEAVRWASADPGLAHLGVTLPAWGEQATQHTVLRTGRMDPADIHDGLPPEPMMLLMKWLAREAREQTTWACKVLQQQTVTWQFDAADGLRHAAIYDAAPNLNGQMPRVVHLRMGTPLGGQPDPNLLWFARDEGLHGGDSLAFQDELVRRVRRVLEAGVGRQSR